MRLPSSANLFIIGILLGSLFFLPKLHQPTTVTARNAPLRQAQGNASKPYIIPTKGIVSKGFSKYHEGIDIAGNMGQPILAAKDGKVIKSGWDEWGLGNAVEIQHPDGSSTVYGHNSKLLVRVGQTVEQGKAIAHMGSTGNSTAPHLHFEIYIDNQAVDPNDYIQPNKKN